MRGVWVTLLAAFLAFPPTSWAQEPTPPPTFPFVLITDPSDDTQVPATGPFAAIDVRRVEVQGEDPEVIDLGFIVAPFKVKDHDPTYHYFTNEIVLDYKVLNMTGRLTVTLDYFIDPANGSAAALSLSRPGYARAAATFADGTEATPHSLGITLDPEKDTIHVGLRREALYGGSQGLSYGVKLEKGHALRDIVATTYGTPDPPDDLYQERRVEDRAPNSGYGTSYTFLHDPPSTVLQVRLGEPQRILPVKAGGNHSVRLTVANLAPDKRLINLTYAARWDYQPTKEIQVVGPTSLSLPGGRWRNYTVFVSIPLSAAGGRQASVVVEALAPASGDLAKTYLFMRVGRGFDPAQNQLYLHVREYRYYGAPDAACSHNTVFLYACGSYAFLSGKKQEEGTNPDGAVEVFFEDPQSAWIPGVSDWLPVAEPVAFIPGAPANVNLTLATYRQTYENVDAEFSLFATTEAPSTRTILGTVSKPLTLSPTAQTLRFQIPLRLPDDGVLQAGHSFGLALSFRVDEVTRHAAYALGETPRLFAKDFHVRYPLAPLPPEYLVVPEISPFQVAFPGEAEEFVNPGRTRLLNITVTNIDADEQRMRFEATTSSPGWPFVVKPALMYDIPSAESVTLGVLVTAPVDAKDGMDTNVTIRALADDGSAATLRLRMTVTEGGDVPDEKEFYVENPDEQAFAAATPTPTPGPALALLLLAAFAGARLRGGARASRHPTSEGF